MPLALTILGIGATSIPFRFCYALIRTVRGSGGYPYPSLPREALSNAGTSVRLDRSAVELWVWDRVFEGEQEAEFEAELDKGRFLIPSDCPVEPGVVLEGLPFAPVLVTEKYSRVVCDGAGALWSTGFVVTISQYISM